MKFMKFITAVVITTRKGKYHIGIPILLMDKSAIAVNTCMK